MPTPYGGITLVAQKKTSGQQRHRSSSPTKPSAPSLADLQAARQDWTDADEAVADAERRLNRAQTIEAQSGRVADSAAAQVALRQARRDRQEAADRFHALRKKARRAEGLAER